jgi:shikimate kinase
MPGARVVWLNGPFGGGKTSVARSLVALRQSAVLFDPEPLGESLLTAAPDVDDFQDLPEWRELVIAGAARLAREGAELLIMPISVLDAGRARELRAGLEGQALTVRHVLLDVPEQELRRRIAADTEEPEAAARWRRSQLPRFLAARRPLGEEADLVVDTDGVSIGSVSTTIAEAGILDQMRDRGDIRESA